MRNTIKRGKLLIVLLLALLAIATMSAFSIQANEQTAMVYTGYEINIDNYFYIDSYNAISSTSSESADFRTITIEGSTHGVQRIMYSGRPRADSIVIVLLAEGFRSDNIGTWPTPAADTFLYHTEQVMQTMINTHPFSEFSHLFTVYAVQVVSSGSISGWNRSINQENEHLSDQAYHDLRVGDNIGINSGNNNSYFRSVFLHDGDIGDSNLIIPTAGQNLARRVAYAAAVRNNVDMIHIIGNPANTNLPSSGKAWIPGGDTLSDTDYNRMVGLSLTTACQRQYNPHWTRDWHGVFIHEFGHSFGDLADEYDISTTPRFRRANITSVNNPETIKWSHWLGHGAHRDSQGNAIPNTAVTIRQMRNVAGNYINWFAPSTVTRNANGAIANSSCIMASRQANRFSAVSSAELTRRLAHLSRETFNQGRSPDPNRYQSHQATLREEVTAHSEFNRILPYAFHGNRVLHTLTIPANIQYIGRYAFIGATGLRVIRNYSTTPQEIDATTFAGTGNHAVYDGLRVYIPRGTRQAYIAAGWGDFYLTYSEFVVTFYRNIVNQGSFTRVVSSNSIMQEPPAPFRPNYILLHWAQEDKLLEGINIPFNFHTTPITRDKKMIAQWQRTNITISFGCRQEKEGSITPPPQTMLPPPVTRIYQSLYGELPTAQRVGYIFTGWLKRLENDGYKLINYWTIITIAQDHTIIE